MKPIITLQPPKAISLECTDPENPPWTEDMLGPPIMRFGSEAQKLPIKISTTINLDVDILSWFKSQDVEYEVLIRATAPKKLPNQYAILQHPIEKIN